MQDGGGGAPVFEKFFKKKRYFLKDCFPNSMQTSNSMDAWMCYRVPNVPYALTKTFNQYT